VFDLTRLPRGPEGSKRVQHLLQIFWMNGDSPSPAACFLRGETRIVMPSLVEELVRTIRKIARREGGDRVEDLSDLSRGCLGLGDLSK
jgi:hypothetical protein